MTIIHGKVEPYNGPEKKPCTDDHWHHLWGEFNRQTRGDLVRVQTPALNDVVQCGGKMPMGLMAEGKRPGRQWCQVNRPALFEFLNAHRKTCGKVAP